MTTLLHKALKGPQKPSDTISVGLELLSDMEFEAKSRKFLSPYADVYSYNKYCGNYKLNTFAMLSLLSHSVDNFKPESLHT